MRNLYDLKVAALGEFTLLTTHGNLADIRTSRL